MSDFANHAKKSHIVDRDKWDWSLSNCDLGRLYGMSPQAIRKTRIKFGLQKFVRPKTPKPPPMLIDSRHLTMDHIADGPKVRIPLQERFSRFYVRGLPDECWIWIGTKNAGGYGTFVAGVWKKNRSTHVAHRIAYVLNGKEIPAGYVVRHKCDTRACVNPSHLELGLQKDNVDDAVERGNLNCGEKNGNNKYTRGQILQIRHLISVGKRQFEIVKLTGISPATVYSIFHGKSWGTV